MRLTKCVKIGQLNINLMQLEIVKGHDVAYKQSQPGCLNVSECQSRFHLILYSQKRLNF